MPGTRQVRAALMARLMSGAAASLLAGCTMCPDPYDYSGPVPNGSAPQNDFRARSNGIEPVGLAPRPWPPIVSRDRQSEQPVAVIAEVPATGEATE
jgi:hypothetical protein